MDYQFNEKEKAWRDEVEEFIVQALPKGWVDSCLYWPAGYGTIPAFEVDFVKDCTDFYHKLGEKGWLTLGWPGWNGDRHTFVEQAILGYVMSYYRAPFGNIATGIGGATISRFASEEMKKEWLHRIAAGEINFWLGYSEPNSGSDLASLQTGAVLDGDDLIINGSKIWSSGAHVSDCAWMVVRTDPKASRKYSGMTLLIVPNDTPGITIRPIVNICGFHSFNEVFFDDVRVPKKNVVGEINQGWYYLMVALEHERLMVPAGGFKRNLEELIKYAKETKRNGKPLSQDPFVRNSLADLAIKIEVVNKFYWQTAWKSDRGIGSETDASILKLISTEVSRDLAHVSMDILGPYGQLMPGAKRAVMNGRVPLGYLDCISSLVGAGTSEIQRNIIAMRGLGLMPGK